MDLISGGGGGYLGQFSPSMCRWPLKIPVPLETILWLIIETIIINRKSTNVELLLTTFLPVSFAVKSFRYFHTK